MAREKNTTPTRSSAAHYIERLDDAVGNLITTTKNLEDHADNVVALLDDGNMDDAKYIVGLAIALSLSRRFKVVLNNPAAQAEMLFSHISDIDKLKKE